jgi:chromosome partitioning protein
MTVFTVINQKGGVGKSTTAHAIGSGLWLQGYSVLLVDLDAQGNLTYASGAENVEFTAFDVLTKAVSAEKAISSLAQGSIIAAEPGLSGADAILTGSGKEFSLKTALEPLSEMFDFAVIDTPPVLGILSVNALTACDWAIVPSMADVFSLQGIARLGATVDAVRTHCNPELSILGILLTRYSGRAVLNREIAEILRQTAQGLDTRVFSSSVRECISLREAQAKRQDIFSYAPKSNAAVDYGMLVDEILTLTRSK